MSAGDWCCANFAISRQANMSASCVPGNPVNVWSCLTAAGASTYSSTRVQSRSLMLTLTITFTISPISIHHRQLSSLYTDCVFLPRSLSGTLFVCRVEKCLLCDQTQIALRRERGCADPCTPSQPDAVRTVQLRSVLSPHGHLIAPSTFSMCRCCIDCFLPLMLRASAEPCSQAVLVANVVRA